MPIKATAQNTDVKGGWAVEERRGAWWTLERERQPLATGVAFQASATG